MGSIRKWILFSSSLALIGAVECTRNPEQQAGQKAQPDVRATVKWDRTIVVSKSTPTLQVVVNPPLEHGQPMQIGAYAALKDLGADYVRYVPWLPYPKLGVAELEPPT